MPDSSNHSQSIRSKVNSVWLPVLIGILFCLLAGVLWWLVEQRENANLKNRLIDETEYLLSHVETDLQTRIQGIQRLVKRMERRGTTSKEEFIQESSAFYSDFPGFQAIGWVDSKCIIRWIFPFENNQKVVDMDLTFEQNRRLAMENAKNARSPKMTKPIDLVTGGKGFSIFFPVYINGEFSGYVLTVFHIQEWLNYVIGIGEHSNKMNELTIGLNINGEQVYKRASGDEKNGLLYITTSGTDILDNKFAMTLKPGVNFINQNRTILPKLIIVFGILLALLMSFCTYLLQKSFVNEIETNTAKKTLETEVVERQKTEDKLQNILSRLDMATKAGGIGIWDWDVTRNILTWNERMYNLYEIPTDIIPNYDTWQNSIHPDDQERTESLLQSAIKGKAVFNTQFRIRISSGNIRYLGAAARVERNNVGEPLRVIGINWDITELKQAEETMQKNESQFRLLLNSTAEAIYGIDTKGMCTFANPSCLRILGYMDTEQIIGKNMHNLIHHSYPNGKPMRPEDCHIFRAFHEGKGMHRDDEVLWRADGTSFPAEYWSYPQIINGEIAGAVVTFIDITERNSAERKLRESHQQFQGLIETMHDCVWEVDTEWNYRYVGPQIKTILGYEITEIVGKSLFDLMSINESQRLSGIINPIVEHHKNITSLERICIHKKGYKVVLETSALPFFDADGNYMGYRGTDHDITERKQAEEEIRLSEEKFSKAFQTSPNAIVITQLDDGFFVDVNNTFCELTGYTRKEVLKDSTIGLRLWLSLKDRSDVVAMLREGKSVNRKEYQFIKKNNEILIGLFSAQVINLNKKLCLLSTIEDITGLKRMEETLRRHRRFLSDLIENSGAVISVKDKDGRFELVNQAWELLTGISREDCIGKRSEDVLPDYYGKMSRIHDLEVIDSDGVVEKEEILEDISGKRYFISIKFPIRDDEGKIKGVCSMNTEITGRKKTEELLATERQRLANILEGTNVGTWEWNVQTGETVFNERWAEIVGYTLSELAPVSIETWMKLAHPDDLKISEELLNKHFNKLLNYYEYEARMRHKNGSWVWVLDRGKVMSWTDDGKPLIMAGTHQDITERKLAEEKVRHLATHDALTDLPSLRTAKDRLNMAIHQARRNKNLAALMFIDLDGFKSVNDTYGHDAGDYVLKQVSSRLVSCVRETDTVARIGGDEFLLIATSLQSIDNAGDIAAKIISLLSSPIIYNKQMIIIGASIGIAVFPDNGEDPEHLIWQADKAMYQIKQTGKNNFAFAENKKV